MLAVATGGHELADAHVRPEREEHEQQPALQRGRVRDLGTEENPSRKPVRSAASLSTSGSAV
jgi:hypothetical protein